MNKKADAYVKFSAYNGQEKTPNTSGYSSNYKDMPKPEMDNPQKEFNQPHRVKEIDCDGLYTLLTNPSYQVSPDGKPMKILVKVHTDWCGPCKKVAPKIEELSVNPNYSDILFVGLNGDKILDHPLKKYINISAVPVFFGFVGGKKVDMIIGPDVSKIQNMCQGMANM